jgi:hypothetical protein
MEKVTSASLFFQDLAATVTNVTGAAQIQCRPAHWWIVRFAIRISIVIFEYRLTKTDTGTRIQIANAKTQRTSNGHASKRICLHHITTTPKRAVPTDDTR